MNASLVVRTSARAGHSVLRAGLIGTILSLSLMAPLSAQTITLRRPNGGESWTAGGKHAIHWDWTGSTDSVNLEYSTDGGSTWNIILSSAANDGDVVWTVPNTPSTDCRAKVTSTKNPNVYDASDTSFTIARPALAITRPNGGPGAEIWTVGEKHAIHWNWSGSISSVNLDYSTDGGSTWNVVLSNVTNDGDALWTVPNTPSSTCRVKVMDTSDTSCFDISDSDFSIIRPTISIARPDSGETYYAGKDAPIHWTWSGSFGTVQLEYSTNGGSSWAAIASSTANDGDYCWFVPSGVSGTTCRVKITDTDDPNSYGVSAANFKISDSIPPDSMHLCSPRTGDVWLVGNYYYICWTQAGSNSSVKLEYATDGGLTWNLITSRTANDGEYEWHVPSTPSAICRIRISDADNPSIYDRSDLFTIEKQWIMTNSPQTGDAWLVGRYHYITWNWGGQFSDVKLQYSTDRGSTWSLIIGSTSNDGVYEWKTPEPASANSQLRITNNSNPEVFGLTDIFQAAPQTIAVTSPLTDDIWQAGRRYYITWDWAGQFSSAKLEYSTDRGSTWSLISGSASSGGYFEWHVPNTGSTNCKIRVSNSANSAVYAVSGVFTILPEIGISEQTSGPVSQSLAAQPNPSHGRTVLRYVLKDETPVDLAVFDASGRRVRVLVGARATAGTHSVGWDGRDESGRLLPPGVYFCRIAAGGFQAVQKLTMQ